MKEVPVYVAIGLTPAQVKAFRLADNQTHEETGWDEELLKLELGDLSKAEFNISLLGFDPDELSRWIGDQEEAPEPQLDRAAELQKKWGTERGQIWEIGRHRLMCSSATDGDVLLSGQKPALCVTDPPCGVEYEPGWRDGVVDEFGSSARVKDAVANDDSFDWRAVWSAMPCDVSYVWHAGKFAAGVQESLIDSGFDIRSQIIWVKQHFAISRGDYHWKHEPCWYAVRKGKASNFTGDRTQTTVWEINSLNPAGREEERFAHGTQKPIECTARPIRNHQGDVYDPFLGLRHHNVRSPITGPHLLRHGDRAQVCRRGP